MLDSPLSQPLRLPCGLTLPNRLAKAALTEQMGDRRNLPSSSQFTRAYGAWGDGGWGIILTGNVQIDERFMGGHADTAMNATIAEDDLLAAYKSLATACRRSGTPAIMQLNHPGRQSPIGAGKRPLLSKTIAPSAVAMNIGPDFIARALNKLIFGTPKEMSSQEIQDVIQRFANAARIAALAGFDGVQVHAAHGYLLTQFMSAKTNLRTDAYGGSPAARVKIVVDIINAIRAVVPKNFCVGLKMNSADHQSSGGPEESTELQDCLEQAAILAATGLDFLEVSGGSYENPTMITGAVAATASTEKTAARESFFLDFARELRSRLPNVPLMVTGGFRTREGMEAAIKTGACDLVGIGRPAILNPSLLVTIILNKEVAALDAKVHAERIETPWLLKKLPKPIGAGVESAWYSKQIQKIE